MSKIKLALGVVLGMAIAMPMAAMAEPPPADGAQARLAVEPPANSQIQQDRQQLRQDREKLHADRKAAHEARKERRQQHNSPPPAQ